MCKSKIREKGEIKINADSVTQIEDDYKVIKYNHDVSLLNKICCRQFQFWKQNSLNMRQKFMIINYCNKIFQFNPVFFPSKINVKTQK